MRSATGSDRSRAGSSGEELEGGGLSERARPRPRPAARNEISDDRRALGLAVGQRAEECALTVEVRMREHRWEGRPPSDEYILGRRRTVWCAHLLIARYLVSGVTAGAEEQPWLTVSPQMVAEEQLSIVNIIRAHYIYRDTATQIVKEEARRLNTPSPVAKEALAVVMISSDRSVITAARAFDAHLRLIGAELEREHRALEHDALHDKLTGLPNRTLLYDRLAQAQALAQRDGSTFAVLLADLDGFKAVNDGLGHHVGDLVLQEVAVRLQASLRAADTVARLGGDEFVAVFVGADQRAAIATARRILRRLQAPMPAIGDVVTITASLGIAVFPASADTVRGLVMAADNAMYTAKKHRGSFHVVAAGELGTASQRNGYLGGERWAETAPQGSP